MEAAAGTAAEPAAWAAEPFAEPEPGSEELEAGGALDRVLRESVCQQQGWVRVYDVKGPPTHRLSCGQSPYTEMTTWERKYCILTDSQLVLLNREKEVPTDGIQEPQDASRGRCLRRTVSVPSEGQFPDYPAEGAAQLVGAESSRAVLALSAEEEEQFLLPCCWVLRKRSSFPCPAAGC
uniref:RAS protein activator like 2 n=1 Tax=Cyanoderma ruficeps TaxID=181631 RepID=A0A8C3RJ24_9PASS